MNVCLRRPVSHEELVKAGRAGPRYAVQCRRRRVSFGPRGASVQRNGRRNLNPRYGLGLVFAGRGSACWYEGFLAGWLSTLEEVRACRRHRRAWPKSTCLFRFWSPKTERPVTLARGSGLRRRCGMHPGPPLSAGCVRARPRIVRALRPVGHQRWRQLRCRHARRLLEYRPLVRMGSRASRDSCSRAMAAHELKRKRFLRRVRVTDGCWGTGTGGPRW